MHPLSRWRRDKRFTQKDLALKSGLRQATISQIERGQQKPHKSTLSVLARVLGCSVEDLCPVAERKDWPFLAGLDRDLRAGLKQDIIALWTHHSTAIEGNTLSEGDTRFVLSEGLTVAGHKLQEHQEIHGHAHGVEQIADWLSKGRIGVEDCHAAHRLIQTGVVRDIFAPVGKWKVERNGTTVITSSGTSSWHDYAEPGDVAELMKGWLKQLNHSLQHAPTTSDQAVALFTDLHLGFTGIHPYADGNGRLARLCANLPLLAAGQPPLLINSSERRRYIELMGDYTLARGKVSRKQDLVAEIPERQRLELFFTQQWELTQELVATYQNRQKTRR